MSRFVPVIARTFLAEMLYGWPYAPTLATQPYPYVYMKCVLHCCSNRAAAPAAAAAAHIVGPTSSSLSARVASSSPSRDIAQGFVEVSSCGDVDAELVQHLTYLPTAHDPCEGEFLGGGGIDDMTGTRVSSCLLRKDAAKPCADSTASPFPFVADEFRHSGDRVHLNFSAVQARVLLHDCMRARVDTAVEAGRCMRPAKSRGHEVLADTQRGKSAVETAVAIIGNEKEMQSNTGSLEWVTAGAVSSLAAELSVSQPTLLLLRDLALREATIRHRKMAVLRSVE